MPQIYCGHCKSYHGNIAAVRACSRRHITKARADGVRQIMANNRRNMADPTATGPGFTEPPPTPTAYKRPNEWQLTTPREMVENMREGRYAVEITLPGKPTDWVFLRVSRPTRGKKAGSLVLQTQHSDYYKPYLTIYPSGSLWFAQTGEKLDLALMMVAADPVTSAINYGRELGCCSRCGRELTDERSRWYSIGPECEKYWPEIITYVNETKGVFVP